MALIGCVECGKQISDKATTCPSCGAPVEAASLPPPPQFVAAPGGTPEQPPKKRGTVGTAIGVLVLLALAGVLYAMRNSRLNDKAALPGAGILGALRQPKRLVNERAELKEGESKIYGFTTSADARVQVKVKAKPRRIDVMLLNDDDLKHFR